MLEAFGLIKAAGKDEELGLLAKGVSKAASAELGRRNGHGTLWELSSYGFFGA